MTQARSPAPVPAPAWDPSPHLSRPVQDALEDAAEELFEGLRRTAQARGVDLETRILVGHAAEQILRLAADTGTDLIVVGHRGHSKIREWLFGSTSRRVVSHAPCSVLVARRK